MRIKIYILHFINSFILLISFGTLGCHIAQLVLLSKGASEQWWPHYIPYIFYYVGSIFSILSSASLLLLTCFYANALWTNRVLSVINLLLAIAFIVYISLKSGTIPWPESATHSQKGFASYCSTYSNDPLIYKRCWLVNGSWLGTVIYGFSWLVLATYSWLFLKRSDIVSDDYDSYDFKQDVPMSVKYEAPPHDMTDAHSPSQESYYYSSRGTPLHHTGYEIDRHPYYDEQHTGYHNLNTNNYNYSRRLSKTYLEEVNPS